MLEEPAGSGALLADDPQFFLERARGDWMHLREAMRRAGEADDFVLQERLKFEILARQESADEAQVNLVPDDLLLDPERVFHRVVEGPLRITAGEPAEKGREQGETPG